MFATLSLSARLRWLALTICLMLASGARALDLMEAHDLALQRDPSFQSATKDYEAGLQNAPLGRSAMLPKVSANYSNQTNNTTVSSTTANTQPIHYGQYGSNYSALQVTQPFFNLEALARLRQGNAQAQFAQSKYQYLKFDLSYRVLQSYTDLLFAMDHLQFQEAEQAVYDEQAKLSEKQYQKGELTVTDLLQAKSGALLVKTKVLEAKDDVENLKRKLEGIVGQKIDLAKLAKVHKRFVMIQADTKTFDQWEELTLTNNIELAAMKNQIDVAYQEYKKNVAGHFPVVNFVAAGISQASNTTNTINQASKQSYLGVQVNIPLYSGGETQSRSAQAYASYQKALADYEVARERVITELRKQYDLIQTGPQKIQALTEAEASVVRLVDSMRKSVKGGERINLDILVSEKTLRSTKKDLSQAKYQYLIAYLKLYQMGGLFDDADFKKIATYFVK
jgi:protease secretion system outer membrane protein